MDDAIISKRIFKGKTDEGRPVGKLEKKIEIRRPRWNTIKGNKLRNVVTGPR